MTRPCRLGDSRGFTLIELLVVVVVIGILATIALSAFLSHRQKGWDAAVESDLRNAATVQHTVYADGAWGAFATTIDQLAAAGLRMSAGENYFGGTAQITVAVTAGEDYCMTARSASGRYLAMSSERGLVARGVPFDTDTCL